MANSFPRFARERLRVIAIIGLAALPLVALEAVVLGGQQQAARDAVQSARLAIARAAAVDADSYVDGNVSTLVALAQTRPIKGADSTTVNAIFQPVLQTGPNWITLGLSSADGWNVSSLSSAPHSVNIADRDYFQAALAGRTGIGSVINARGNLRAKTIVIGVPVTFNDGTKGALSGALNLSKIEEELRQIVPLGGIDLRVVDRLGQEFIGPDSGGDTLPNVSARPEVQSGFGGIARALVAPDARGQEALIAYAPAPAAGWVVVLSEPTAAAFAGPDALGRVAGTLTLAGLAVALAIAWYFGGRLARSYTGVDAERHRLYEGLRLAPARVGLLRGPELRYAVVSTEQLSAMRLTEKDIIGKRFDELNPNPAQVALLKKVYESGEAFVRKEAPTKLRLANGTEIDSYYDFAIVATRDANGAVDGLIYHAVDVTDTVTARRRIEDLAAAVSVERDELQQIVNEMPEGVVVMYKDRRTTRNRVADELLGGPLTRELDAPAADSIPRRPDGVRYAFDDLPILRALARGEVVRGEEMLVRNPAVDADLNLLVSASPVRRDGEIVAAVSVFQDITQIRSFERQRTEFFSMASHEIRTPVTAIQLQLDLALRQMARGDTSRTQELMTKARQRTKALTALINDLLDITRLDVGRFRLDPEPIDLGEVVRSAVEDYPSDGQHPIAVISSGGAMPVLADPRRMVEVLENLLSNAVKYSPDGGDISVEVGREKQTAVVRIRDNGLGVPEGERDRIFERFYRTSIAKPYGGVGLGLYISKEIVTRLGGDIELESTSERGSVFRVTLPLMRVPAASS